VQPIGDAVDFTPRARPSREPIRGAHVVLRQIDAAHDAEPLYAASHPPAADEGLWTYMPYGPFAEAEQFRDWLAWAETSEDPVFYTVVTLPDERPSGIVSYLRIAPEHGVIEIGHIWFGAHLQRTTAATEAIYLLARHAFDELGYRRLEWKCNALNAASRRAAERFGFQFEGIFRQHMVIKGRNRDTAWFAITDQEWRAVRTGFEAWLAPENFDDHGRQRRPLVELIKEAG
jgi:RimJ/RimL family protein N-acetyltransferase